MGERDRWSQKPHSTSLELDASKKWRRPEQGVDGRTHVVSESGECQVCAPRSATWRRRALVDIDAQARSRKGQRRRQAVRPRTDDHDITGSHPVTSMPKRHAPDNMSARARDWI